MDLFSSIVVDCEGLINSRLLNHVSCDINDTLPLTPNHFPHGRLFIYASSTSLYDWTNPKKLSKKSWKPTKDQLDSFWKRQTKEYSATLIKPTKCAQKVETKEKQDLVWIFEDFTLREIWPLGKVFETFTGPDGIARSWVIKTALGALTRPAAKLASVEPKLDF